MSRRLTEKEREERRAERLQRMREYSKRRHAAVSLGRLGASGLSEEWQPKAHDIPLLERGLAFRLVCEDGHKFIGTAGVVTCPVRNCGKKMARR